MAQIKPIIPKEKIDNPDYFKNIKKRFNNYDVRNIKEINEFCYKLMEYLKIK